ncbi:SLBB domain-containing protein [Desulfuromonas sp. CSMB_57]|uniref:SLBB domain-containing protein n=1 Tax=Desulfuromonas sp. CSMB_57 TaxID=2807629 RepID=UPI0020BE6D44|nr:SLBB domain-containing protein [Desulfuromonas sp. CSMB_57]
MKNVPWILALSLLVCFWVPVLTYAAEIDYRIGEGDVLRVLVYDNPDLNTNARVSGQGTIIFPLVGEVAIGGLTVSQAAQKIGRELANGYIRDPQVTVFVEEFRSQRVTIMGEVRTPGLHELSGSTSLMELISKAGGLTPDADFQATINRKRSSPQEAEQQINVNLRDLLDRREGTADVALQDGDSVFIPRAGVYYVTGQVRRPGSFRLEPGTSVIKAITMAGGFTELAAQKRVRIIRKVDGVENVMQRVPLHMPVIHEDVIVVPESFF